MRAAYPNLIAEGAKQAFMGLVKAQALKGSRLAARRPVEGLLYGALMPPQPSVVLKTGCGCLTGTALDEDQAALRG